MSLVKHRPKIKLYLPATAYPGRSVRATVELDARHAVPIQHLDVRLEGSLAPAGQGSVFAQATLVRLGARLSGAREIPVGKTRFECQFPLPENLPPTHQGATVSVGYGVHVHVGVDWWPDADQRFWMNVGIPPVPRNRVQAPALYSSAPDGPKGTEPFAELSLDDGYVENGGVLAGAIALGNVAHARYVGIDLAIVGMEDVVFWTTTRRELARFVVRLRVDRPEEGKPIPFRIRVPQAQPSFRSQYLRLEWHLEIRARRRFGTDLSFSVPVFVLPASGEKGDEPKRAMMPVVGTERLERVWQAVGEPLGYRLVGDELQAQSGETAIVVRRELRDDGMHLVADLRYPSLGIGLDGGLTRGLAGWFGKGIETGAPAFDREHRLNGRNSEQTRVFLHALALTLAALPPDFRVSRVDDQQLNLETRGAGLTSAPLAQFGSVALALANAIIVARPRIPAPPGFDLPSWQKLAQSFGGTLALGSMAVAGEVDGHRLEIRTEWAGDNAYATLIRLAPRGALDPRACGIVRGSATKSAAPEPVLVSEAEPIARALAEKYGELEIAAEALSISLPALLQNAEPAQDVAHDLGRLADLLAVKRSAYR